MQRLITISILIAALALSGCATTSGRLNKPYASNPKHSYAWNVAKAAGLNVKDVPWEKVQKAREEALAKGAPVDSGPSVLGAATFGVAHGMSMGSLLSGGLGALAWMSVGNSDPAAWSRMFAWMPRELAATPEEAQDFLYQAFRDASHKALRETSLPSDFSVTKFECKRRSKHRSECGFFIRGEGLESEEILVRYPLFGDMNAIPQKGMGPAFINSKPSWSWSHIAENGISFSGPTFVVRNGLRRTYEARLPDLEVYAKLSGYLPSWVFIYLAPNSRISMSDGKGGFKFLEYPLILNQGEAHFFVEPPPEKS